MQITTEHSKKQRLDLSLDPDDLFLVCCALEDKWAKHRLGWNDAIAAGSWSHAIVQSVEAERVRVVLERIDAMKGEAMP